MEKYKKQLIKIIEKHLPDCKIYLYGSRARGDHRHGSDFDIALDYNQKIDWKPLSEISEEIEESTIPYFVDIVDINNIDEDFKKRIKKDKVIWKN